MMTATATGVWMVKPNTEEFDDDDGLSDGLVGADGEPLTGKGSRRNETGAEKAARYRARPDAGEVQAENRRAAFRKGDKGMKCPKCHCQNFRVLETRPGEDSKVRRRECRTCGYVFGTTEIVTTDLTQGQLIEEVFRKLHGG